MFRGRKRRLPSSVNVRDLYFHGYGSEPEQQPHPHPHHIPLPGPRIRAEREIHIPLPRPRGDDVEQFRNLGQLGDVIQAERSGSPTSIPPDDGEHALPLHEQEMDHIDIVSSVTYHKGKNFDVMSTIIIRLTMTNKVITTPRMLNSFLMLTTFKVITTPRMLNSFPMLMYF